MSDLLELAAQYREAGLVCRGRLKEYKKRLSGGQCGFLEQLELKQGITMLTAMSRDCIEISNFLFDYYERRKKCGQESGKAAGK